MIYSTTETITAAYIWNASLQIDLEPDTNLSDYTGLEEEFDTTTLSQTYENTCLSNGIVMESPALMLITTGTSKSCRVWVDKSTLIALPDIKDPKKTFEYYSED